MALTFLASACSAAEPRFNWTASDPLIQPKPDATHASVAVKDPTIVFANGKYHLFMTTAGDGWHMAYTSFADWSQAPSAPITYLDQSPIGPGYRAAPQVFYFEPQKLWYLIYQGGDPLYSTTANIDDPMSWTAPKPFIAKVPDNMKKIMGKEGNWLDFWIICDDAKCHLFNTDDNGHLFRSETSVTDFPEGFGNTALVLADDRDRLFEASMTYKLAGTDKYVTMIEAISRKGRYFRAWTADRLDGEWTLLADKVADPFAGSANVTFSGADWTDDISHGEIIRSGSNQKLEIDPCQPMRFLFQGFDPKRNTQEYIKLPYRLGLLTAIGENPISRMCPTDSR
jgi:endo-1,4-beta-xylanase